MTKQKTGIFITPKELEFVVQLFGTIHTTFNQENKDKLNNYMKMLAMKYDYEDYWLASEIEPISGEVILNKPDDCCDEKVSEDNVEVEE
jgi:hypothetical protein